MYVNMSFWLNHVLKLVNVLLVKREISKTLQIKTVFLLLFIRLSGVKGSKLFPNGNHNNEDSSRNADQFIEYLPLSDAIFGTYLKHSSSKGYLATYALNNVVYIYLVWHL